MQIGLAQRLALVETRTAPFEVTDYSGVVVLPDATTISLSVLSTQIDAYTWELSAFFTASMVGLHTITWVMEDGAGSSSFQQFYFVTYLDVNGMAAQRVLGAGKRFDESALGIELENLLSKVYAEFPCIAKTGYDALSAGDRAHVDFALSWLVACRMQTVIVAGATPAGVGALLGWREAGDAGGVEERYSDKTSPAFAEFAHHAAEEMVQVACVAKSRASLASGGLPLFGYGGSVVRGDIRGKWQPLVASMGRILQSLEQGNA